MRFSEILIWINRLRARYFQQRQFIYLLSGIIGLAVGLSAVVIKNLVHFISSLLTQGLPGDFQSYLYFVFPVIGILLTIFFIRYINKRTVGHGIPGVLYAISKNRGIIRRHNLYSSIITSALTVGFGGSVGLEGPTVATGAAIGSNIGRSLNLSYKEIVLLLACASAGAMSAIFKAPIAAIVFALEVIMVDLTIWSMIPLLIASATAGLTSYLFTGQNVLYTVEITESFTLSNIPYYLMLAIFTGFLSVYFTRVYIFISRIFEENNNIYKRLFIGGGLLGILIFFVPSLYGEGYEVINESLRGDVSHLFANTFYGPFPADSWYVLLLLLLLILLKSIATSLTFAAGGIGGIFAPSLFTGVSAGLFFALLMNRFGADIPVSNFALVGMAGMIAGVIHAPLTAIFLIAELTGGHELFMPLMLASTISYATVRIFEKNSVYTFQLAKRGELMTHDKDKNTLLMMNVSDLIEKNFKKVHPDDTLGDLVKIIKKSKRNIFPVVDDEGYFQGIVKLDEIRNIMFEIDLYEKTSVRELMFMPQYTIGIREPMEEVARKFHDSDRYNIAVVRDGKYVGFVSRAKVFSSYRDMLKEFSDE
ncbi:MAG: chloride channel protein [Bacteroidales bacterium]|nr:chloride channel protein [Bacteroidales bacterium]MCF8390388.1 chloride channel protein [Bacteroidales bacterium]